MAHPVPGSAAAGTLAVASSALGGVVAGGDVGLAWHLRPEVALPLAVAATLYALGWWRLARRSARAPSTARPALALVGLAATATALLSPLDALAHRLFVAHMVQHMLLIAVAAPALLLADPFPMIVWALPGPVRRRAGRWLRPGAPARRAWVAATAMPAAWLTYAAILWLWHLPTAYDAALGDRLVHDAEHAAFFVGAVTFWWPVVHPAPRFRRPYRHTARIVYLVLGAFQVAALGLLLTVAPAVLYQTYATATRSDGLSAIDDQAWGGVVMWAAGGLIDMIAVLALLYRALGASPSPPPAPRTPAFLDTGSGAL